MNLWQNYHTPTTVEEALAHLATYNGEARIIAGGTDLLIDLQHSLPHEPITALVDVTRIPEMTRINTDGAHCTIGGAVTHTAIVQSPVLEAGATCLVESCGVVGGPQVRNVGTLGGNVAHALPAGDGTTSLVALNADVQIAWGNGQREWRPILDTFRGPGQSAIDSTRDVLVSFRFDLCGPGEATAFKRVMRPQGVALPVLGCAVWVKLDDDRISAARICIGPVDRVPIRATAAEEAVIGVTAQAEAVRRAIEAARESLHPRTSKYRATAEYRALMIETLLKDALPLAIRRAQTGAAVAEGVGLG